MTAFVTVNVTQGSLRGRRTTSKTGTTYFSFQGIPYAKPPLGPLRFKTAVPPEPWSGVRDALVEGDCCCQYDYYHNKYIGSEDCLVLNVYSPQLPGSGTSLLPVMVWIHGGGYVAGSGNAEMYGPDYLVDAGVVLITINYRLGVLGFLSLDDPAAPGNVGLKDQVAALQWVQKNITNFGGDPQNVTIFGESAGGASVHFHMLSPMSTGLFHKAISMSGAAFNPWGWEAHQRDMAFRLGAELGCTTKDPQELVNFLRSVDHTKLVKAATDNAPSEQDKERVLSFAFVPSLECIVDGTETFLPASPLQLLEEGHYKAVPYITGITADESLFLFKLCDMDNILKKLDHNFQEVVLPELQLPGNFKKLEEICSKIRKFFFKNNPINKDTLPAFLDMYSDLYFGKDIHLTLKKMAKWNLAPLYYYCFSYHGELNFLNKVMGIDYSGTSHLDDIGYLFRVKNMDPDLTPESPDVQMRKKFVKLWTNFAKTGNPTPDAEDTLLPVTWQPYNTANPCYLNIGKEMNMKKNLHQERMAFWEELYHFVSQ